MFYSGSSIDTFTKNILIMENAIQIKFLYLRDFFQNKFPKSNYFVIK